MASIGSTYAPSPIIIGGRKPLKPGQRPPLAELVPEITMPRSCMVQQIKSLMQSKRLVVVLALPGAGKSVLARNLRQEFRIPWNQSYYSEIRRTYPEISYRTIPHTLDGIRAGDPGATLLLDDVHPLAHVIENTPRLLEQGRKVVVFHPPAYEKNYARLVKGLEEAAIVILPPADLEEFSDAHMRIARCLSREAARGVYDLCGGNMRLARFVIFGPEEESTIQNKIRAGKKLDPAEVETMVHEIEERFARPLHSLIFINFKDHLPFLLRHFEKKGLPVTKFWELPYEERESALKLLRYGLLTLTSSGKTIAFRGELIRKRFEMGEAI